MTAIVRTERIERPSIERVAEIEAILASGRPVIAQFNGAPYDTAVLAELNRLARQFDDLLTVRFYSHDSDGFDCATLALLPDVASLNLDCLWRISNVEHLTALVHLTRLSLGVYELRDGSILASPNLRALKELTLAPTKRKVFDLAPLSSFDQLALLRVCGPMRNLDVLAESDSIQTLWLNSIPKDESIMFVSRMRGLRALHMYLGGRETFAGVEAQGLEELEIVRVRGLQGLGDLSRFPALTRLQVEDQIQLEQLRFGPGNAALRHLRISTCKSLRALPGIEALPRLEAVRIYGTALEVATFRRERLAPSLRMFWFSTGKRTLDKKIRAESTALGYPPAPGAEVRWAIEWGEE